MKKVLVTLLTPNFMPGFIAWIKSIKKNCHFKDDLIVIDCGLNEEQKTTCKKYYSRIIFRKPRYPQYAHLDLTKVANHFKPVFYKLDCFSYVDYDRIVFIDIDTLILQDFSYLFEGIEASFSAGSGYGELKEVFESTNLNSGVFVINKEYLNMRTYGTLLSYIGNKGIRYEQDILRKFFKKKTNFLESPKWNYKKHIYASKQWRDKWNIEKDIVILHFISFKPWQDLSDDPYREKLKPLYDLWNYYYTLKENLCQKS